MEDREILALLWQRAEGAIPALAERFGKFLYRTAMNLLNNPRDAEECVNDTYMAVWNSIPPNQPEPLQPYVYRIGRNIALNRLRSNTAQKRGGYELSLDELEGCIPAPCLEDGRALGQAMNAYLDTLNTDNRVIFLRRYWFGDSIKDIAAAFHTTENAVSVRLSRIRDGLKAYLIKEGYYYERRTEQSL
jgi:RNA polymerase sigma-70 factor (ECF subfamily)